MTPEYGSAWAGLISLINDLGGNPEHTRIGFIDEYLDAAREAGLHLGCETYLPNGALASLSIRAARGR